MAPPAIRELHYRIPGAAVGLFPGHHRSRSGDSGFEFRGHALLQDAPDVRRLDLHASLRDPFGGWLVRLHSLRKAVPVALVADLSASMGFEGAQRKLDMLADFTESLAVPAKQSAGGADPQSALGVFRQRLDVTRKFFVTFEDTEGLVPHPSQPVAARADP